MTRPWKATAEQVAEHGRHADFYAWSEWFQHTFPSDTLQGEAYIAFCKLVDGASPPTFRHRVALDQVAEWIAAQHEVTAEEVQALFMPVVKPLEFRQVTSDTAHVNGSWTADCADGWYTIIRIHGDLRVTFRSEPITSDEHATLELAQAAAQAHWEERAMAFWREAFHNSRKFPESVRTVVDGRR